MAETLGALLQRQASATTGRDRERAQLARLLEPDGPVVAYVHGLAGVGKSTLLHAFAADARAAGAVTVELDGHVTYPTQRAVLSALAHGEEPRLEDAVAALGARGEQVVLLVDTFELLHMVDHWFCRTLVPALPANVRVVLAGRDAPTSRWRAYGSLLSALPLANLEPDDALALLAGSGVDEAT